MFFYMVDIKHTIKVNNSMFAISLQMRLKTILMGGVENIPNPVFLLDKQK